MADGKVTFDFTGDASQVEKEFDKTGAAAQKSAQKLDTLEKQAKRASDNLAKAAQAAADAVGKTAEEAEGAQNKANAAAQRAAQAHDAVAKHATRYEVTLRQAMAAAENLRKVEANRGLESKRHFFQQLRDLLQTQELHRRQAEAAREAGQSHVDAANQITAAEKAKQREMVKVAGEQEKQEGSLRGMIGGAAKYLATWVTVSTVMSEIQSKLARIDESRQKTAGVQQSAATRLNQHLWSSGDTDAAGFRGDVAEIEGLVTRNQWGGSEAYGLAEQTLKKAFNATQGNRPLATKIADLAMRTNRFSKFDAPDLASALGVLGVKTGRSPEENAALILSAGTTALTDDPKQLYENIGVASSAGAALESTPAGKAEGARQAAAAWAAFTNNPDIEGRMSATEFANVSQYLDELRDKGLDMGRPPGVPSSIPDSAFLQKLEGMPSHFVDQAKYIRNLPKEQQEVIRKKIHTMGRGRMDPWVDAMLFDSSSEAAMVLDRANATTNYDAGAIRRLETNLENHPAFQAQRAADAAATRTNLQRTNDTVETRQKSAIDLVNEFQAQTTASTSWAADPIFQGHRIVRWPGRKSDVEWAKEMVRFRMSQVGDRFFETGDQKKRVSEMRARGKEILEDLERMEPAPAPRASQSTRGPRLDIKGEFDAEIGKLIDGVNKLIGISEQQLDELRREDAPGPGVGPAVRGEQGRSRERGQ
jgi:hypothetical protein